VVTRENPPNLTNKDFTIEDWGRKITHQQEEGKGKVLIFTVRLQFATGYKQQVFDPRWPTTLNSIRSEFQKQLQKYINALRTLTMERSRLLDLLLCGYPSSWGNKDQLKLSKIEQEAAVENCVSKESILKSNFSKLTIRNIPLIHLNTLTYLRHASS